MIPDTDKTAVIRSDGSLDKALLDRIAREIAANVAARIDQFYPGAMTDRALFNVKCWTRGQVNYWFGPPEPMAPDMDRRLRASAAHRRQMNAYKNLHGIFEPGVDIEAIMAAMDKIDEAAVLDYRAGGPVIEGDEP